MIEEETGTPLVLPVDDGESTAPVETEDGKKLVARDEKRNPIFSELAWTDEAASASSRPAGFMRNRTQQRIEDLARERKLASIDLALVEEGIEARPPSSWRR